MREQRIDFLITEIAKNNSDAVAELFASIKNGVYAFLYPYFNNRADTEDCLQTTFLKICNSASCYQPHTNGRAWIFQIAKNTALDALRREKSTVNVDDLPEKGREMPQTFVFDAMQRVLDVEENTIVVLHVLWGYRHREIAAMLNCPEGTVTSKYKRAVEKLKRELKEN